MNIRCAPLESAGLAFVSVHDCFWTHALTVDTMNKICREQFVALHSQPILQELSNYLVQKYCTGIPVEAKKKKTQEYLELSMCLATVPQTGDFDLQRTSAERGLASGLYLIIDPITYWMAGCSLTRYLGGFIKFEEDASEKERKDKLIRGIPDPRRNLEG
ncbi:hypothetical protein F7725_027530 [Dissostichus mawsoni]|uniref:DNA-directed RNA polymerase n=1 Tax=Dissostichus mawsoni TaxID=36200 RepID=A0A7J5XD63_DISMA|nr:hypothetical protein F7725_027530 [Dissostichus mawsoni]